MPSDAPPCCVFLASSASAQGAYAGALLLSLVVSVVGFALFMDSDDDGGQWVTELVSSQLSLWPAVLMASSRIVTPLCCPGGMEGVPPCCPCNCFTQLDTPWYAMVGFVWSLEAVISAADGFRVFRLLGLCLIVASIICSFVKLFIMLRCCCEHCLTDALVTTSPVSPVISGAPVFGEPVIGTPVDLPDGGGPKKPSKPVAT
jgi:hypothetical protein